jgi:hypothetical protein
MEVLVAESTRLWEAHLEVVVAESWLAPMPLSFGNDVREFQRHTFCNLGSNVVETSIAALEDA